MTVRDSTPSDQIIDPQRLDPLHLTHLTAENTTIANAEIENGDTKHLSYRSANELTVHVLTDLARNIGAVNESKGFRDHGNKLRDEIASDEAAGFDASYARQNYVNHIQSKILLIVNESIEGQDELRAGHAPTETYYTLPGDDRQYPTRQAAVAASDNPNVNPKPEGLISELADIIIRSMDLGDELDRAEELAMMIVEKLGHNRSRPAMHGGKAF